MAKLTLEEYNKLLLEGKIKIINRANPGQDTSWDSIILYALVEKGIDDNTTKMFDVLKSQNLILMPNVYKEDTDLTLELIRDGFAKLRELFIEPPEDKKEDTPVEEKPEDTGSEAPTTPAEESVKADDPIETPPVWEPTVPPPDEEPSEFDRAVAEARMIDTADPLSRSDVTIHITTGEEAPKPTEPPKLTQSEIDMKILMDAYREAILKKIDEVKKSGIDSEVKAQYLKNLNEIIANDDNLRTYVRNAINTGQISKKKLQETIDRGRTIIGNQDKQEALNSKIDANNEAMAIKGHHFLKSRLKKDNKKSAAAITKLAKSNVKLENKQREFFLKAVERDKKRLMRVAELQLDFAEAEAEEAKFAEVRENSKFLTKALAGRKAKKAAKRKTKIESKIFDLNGPVKITGSREIVVDPRDYDTELEADEALVRS
jgi:hypothetical protein